MTDNEASGTAERIRTFRIRAGRSKDDVVQRLGLNPAWYEDLERNDAELASTLTLFQTLDLASLLGVHVHELFPNRGAPASRIDLIDLPALVETHLAARGVSLLQLERHAGWPLEDFMRAPVQSAAELPLAFLQSLAATLGFDWLTLVPEAEKS